MPYLLMYVALIVAMPIVILVLSAVMGWILMGRRPAGVERWVDAIARRRARQPLPEVLLELELSRLAGLLQEAYETPRPGQAHHVRASTAAYDDVLLRCCRVCGLDAPVCQVPLSSARRFDLETRLMSAGVHW